MSDINCPYCNAEQEICHDDGYGMEEGVRHEQECGVCEKTFVYETSISIYHEAFRADCLNGGAHNYAQTHTWPKEYTMMACIVCEKERKPTEDEMKAILNESNL